MALRGDDCSDGDVDDVGVDEDRTLTPATLERASGWG